MDIFTIFFSNKKIINLAFLLRPGVKLDDLSIQVASTLSQEEVLSRIQEVKDRVRPKAFFTEQSVNPLTWRRKPEVWRRRTRTQVLEDMVSEQFSLHCTLSRIRGLFTQDNYCHDFTDTNWIFWKWWFTNINRSMKITGRMLLKTISYFVDIDCSLGSWQQTNKGTL